MEAVPRLPMISFELKTSPESPGFGPKLKQYIAEFYHEDPESYNNEIHALEGLRAAAVRPARDVTGCSILKRYFAQLHALQGRFPMGKGQPLALTFSWKDVYTSSTIQVTDIKFEMASILFNIGSLHTQLGAADSRNSADGMKLACTHFQCAAWSFQHLRENFSQQPSEDMCSEVMGFMVSLSFAQAQECILEKSMADNRKATIVARIAVQVVDYYSMALAALLSGGDDAAVADTVGSKLYKEWKKYIQFKIAYCGCVSLLYQGQQAEEQQKMGERVAFYQAAYNRLEEARKLSKGMDNAEVIADALNFTNDVVEGKRKAARNENEFIYHEEVPEMSALTQATGAPLVKGIAFSVTDKDVLGEDIFKRLVPMSAHEASSVYSEEKAQLLRDVGARVEACDVSLHTHLSALHLQGLQAIDESIPQPLIDRCAALSARPDTTQELVRAMDLLADTCSEVESQLQEIQLLLESEDANEKSYQEKMGTRPVNSVITELTREFSKYKEAHAKAGGSNETLRRAMGMHVNNLKVLAQPLKDLQAAMPKIRQEEVLDESSKNKLQELLDKIEQMRSQRVTLYNQFREAAVADDITAKLVAWGDKPAEELFQKELQKHKDTVALIDQNLSAQDNILRALTEVYARCAPYLKAQMDVVRKRDGFCTSLVASYDAYEDLLAKTAKGTDFYKKLHTNVSKLLARVKSVSNVQQEERTARLQVKSVKVKPENASQPSISVSTTPKLKDYLAAGFGTDSYRVPGIRPRPLGSEGTTETPLDKTPNAFVNPYYQTLDSSHMNINTQIYQSQTEIPTYAGANLYASNYGKIDNKMSADQNLQSTNKVPVNYGTYNYMQYQQPSNSMYTSVADQQVSATNQFQPYNISSKNIAAPTSVNNVQTYNQNTLYNPQMNYSVQQPQQAVIDNKQMYQQGYNATTAQDFNNSTNQMTYPAQTITSSTDGINQQMSNLTLQNNLNSALYNTQTAYKSTDNNMITSNSTIAQNLGTNQQYSGLSTINQQYPTQHATNQQFTTQNTLNQQYPGQNSINQRYTNLETNVNLAQPGYQNTDTNSSSVTNVAPTNQIPNLTINQQFSTQNPSINPNQQYSNPDISQTQSYSGHPGYSYNLNTGMYQYSSGYQNMQNQQIDYGNQALSYNIPSAYPEQQKGFTNPNEYWQQNYNYQYTNAAGNVGTNNTLSSQTGHQGQSFANQYASSTVPSTVSGQYYSQQYGTDVPASSASVSGYQMTPQSPMTYMNSSNNSTTTTYSQDQNTMSVTPVQPLPPVQQMPPVQPMQPPSVQANVDLLAGLDFSSSVPTLTPQLTPVVSKPTPVTKNLNSADISNSSTEGNVSTDSKNQKSEEIIPAKFEEDIEVPEVKDKDAEKKLLALQSPPTKEDLMRFLHEVERHEKYMEGITTKTLNGPTPLETKWKELQDLLMHEHHTRSISVARCYPAKNRNPDYLPYDQTRVSLCNTNDDYINASYIRDLSELCPTLIVTQTPVNNTIADFWSMVWEENVETIVCLQTKKELDVQYFPLQKDAPELYGDFKVTLQFVTENSFCIERIMSIKAHRDKPPRDFVHLQIRSPVNDAESVVGVTNETVSAYQNQRKSAHPILIHCQTGSGLSGVVSFTICAVLTSKTSKPCLLDVLNTCCQLCSQRKSILRERKDLLLAMESELINAKAILNANNFMTTRQIQSKVTSNIPPPQEVSPRDPFKDLDPMWQIRKS